MAEPFLGEIRMFAGNFAPVGWAFCNGQTLAISSNTALFAILGTFYGGNGISTFALPNLQGCVAIHQGTGPGGSFSIGETGGAPSTTLTISNLPSHNHVLNAVASGGNQASPAGALPAIESTGTSLDYSTAAASASMASGAISPTGGGTPINIMQPFLTLSFIIALEGIFPSRN